MMSVSSVDSILYSKMAAIKELEGRETRSTGKA
jgi:hypothetical protein